MPGPNRFPVVRGPNSELSRAQDAIQTAVMPTVTALQATPIMGAAPPAWIRPTPLNGFGSPTADTESLAFHRDALGYVHISGALTHAAGTGALTTMFPLPLGYRQRKTHIYPASTGAAFQGVRILASGEVQNRLAMAAGASIYVELTFLAEQ